MTCLDSSEGMAAVWGTPSVAAPGPEKGHFLPRSAPPSPLLFARPKCGGADNGKTGPGRISSADLRLLEPPPHPAPPDPAGPRAARAAVRAASPAQRFLSDPPPSRPFHPAPCHPAPSQPGFQRKDASPPRAFRRNRVTRGLAGRALGPRSLAEGGAWWGGSAGEVFKLEPELPPRGSGSRGAVEQPWASAGRDPGVWRGVGPWGGRFAQDVPGLRGRGAAAALSQVGAAPRARQPAPRGTGRRAPLESAGCGRSIPMAPSVPSSPLRPPPPLHTRSKA